MFATEPVSPTFRLPASVIPTSYTVELDITPGQDQFSGRIEADVKTAVDAVWLLARDLHLNSVTVDGREARVVPGSYDFTGVVPPEPLKAGRTTLQIDYIGTISQTLTDGVFQQRHGGEWYVFTKFEPVTARRAFPCFDEPSFKTPWQLTLRVPESLKVFSNTLEQSSQVADGHRAVTFARTRPLPSYLIAFAVGPFETVEVGKLGKAGTPARIIVPKGRTADAAYPAANTRRALELLEDYFGIPYPFDKLDQIVVPVTTAWGAMENAGLIAYGDFFLVPPAEDTRRRRFAVLKVMLHEIAHQWFGNLVTMPWWDDIWLNEGFASWIEDRLLDQWHPEWRVLEADVAGADGVKTSDALPSTRRVRQPIRVPADIALAFDGTTYTKGSALLRMYENAVGAETFRRAIGEHLRKFAWGNATTDDLLGTLTRVSKQNVDSSFNSFLNQVGVPMVSVDLRCSSGSATVLLKQHPFQPLSEQRAGRDERIWNIPVCMRWSKDERSCVALDAPAREVALSSPGCPDWLHANENGAGFYRVRYEGGLADGIRTAAQALRPAEKVVLLQDARAAMGLSPDATVTALRFAGEFADADSPLVTGTAAGILAHALRLTGEPVLRVAIREWFGGRARSLGWKTRPSESDDARELRQLLVPFVAGEGQDAALVEEARRLGIEYLKDRARADAATGPAALRVATRGGDAELHRQLVDALPRVVSRVHLAELTAALASFRDPALLRKSLDLVMADPPAGIDRRDLANMLRMVPAESDAVLQAFIAANFEKLDQVMPGARGIAYGATVPSLFAASCSDSRAVWLESFFRPRVAPVAGLERNLNKAVEAVRACAGTASVVRKGVAEWSANEGSGLRPPPAPVR